MNAREGVRAVGAGAVTLFGYRVVKGWLVVVEAGHPIFFRLSFYFRATDEKNLYQRFCPPAFHPGFHPRV
jgi:hypothetical protein